jgi:hypothetical protein
MKTTIKILFSLFLIAGTAGISEAQCNQFAKKTCMPELNPFTHNGQLNIQQMAPGEEAELDLTFYSGMSYRLLICCQDAIGKAQFQVFDNKNKLVFDNKDHNFAKFWEFEVASTQQMKVVVIIPPAPKTSNDLSKTGCAAVLVGFKQ